MSTSTTPEAKSPFKFLDPYGEADREIFFGREKEIEIIYDRVMLSKLLLIYGQSGTGKTSLIHCGLANKFSDSDWFALFVRRNDDIMQSLEREIRSKAVEPIPEDANLSEAVESLYLDHYIPIYLIFDQFEELFIMGTKKEQKDFFLALEELLRSKLVCKVVLIMREEYLAWFSDYEKIIPILFDNRFRVEPMTRAQLEDVIDGTISNPAFGIEMRDKQETTNAILTNLEGERRVIDLTNLQVYLDRLYRKDLIKREKEGNNRSIVFDTDLVKSVGKLPQVLGDFLDEQISDVEKELGEAGIALEVLMTMVTNEGTKRSLGIKELQEILWEKKQIKPEDVELCVKRFYERKILRELKL